MLANNTVPDVFREINAISFILEDTEKEYRTEKLRSPTVFGKNNNAKKND